MHLHLCYQCLVTTALVARCMPQVLQHDSQQAAAEYCGLCIFDHSSRNWAEVAKSHALHARSYEAITCSRQNHFECKHQSGGKRFQLGAHSELFPAVSSLEFAARFVHLHLNSAWFSQGSRMGTCIWNVRWSSFPLSTAIWNRPSCPSGYERIQKEDCNCKVHKARAKFKEAQVSFLSFSVCLVVDCPSFSDFLFYLYFRFFVSTFLRFLVKLSLLKFFCWGKHSIWSPEASTRSFATSLQGKCPTESTSLQKKLLLSVDLTALLLLEIV